MQPNHIKWLNDFKTASSKREGVRDLRVQIFNDTLKFAESGYTIDNKQIVIDNKSIISEYFDKKPEKLPEHATCETKISIINSDCLEAAELLLNSGYNPCVCIISLTR